MKILPGSAPRERTAWRVQAPLRGSCGVEPLFGQPKAFELVAVKVRRAGPRSRKWLVGGDHRPCTNLEGRGIALTKQGAIDLAVKSRRRGIELYEQMIADERAELAALEALRSRTRG